MLKTFSLTGWVLQLSKNTDFNFNFHKNISTDFELDWLVGGNLRSNFNEQNYQQAPKLAVAGLYTLNNSRDPLVSNNVLRKQKVYSAFSSAQLGFRNYAFLTTICSKFR